MTFKETIENIRRDSLVNRFKDKPFDWIDRIWYGSHIKYTKGSSAPKIEKHIIEYIKAVGGQAEKRAVTGRLIDNTKNVKDALGFNRVIGSKKGIKGTGTKDSADISATMYGVAIYIEVKKGKDRQSPDQKKYQSDIEKAGGFYFIANDEDDFLNKWIELMKHPKLILLRNFK